MRITFWSLCVTGTSYVSMGSLLYDTHRRVAYVTRTIQLTC